MQSGRARLDTLDGDAIFSAAAVAAVEAMGLEHTRTGVSWSEIGWSAIFTGDE